MERRIAASTPKHSWKVNMEEKQSQEKKDTYREHSLKRDKGRGKKKVYCRGKMDSLYLSKREDRKN